MLGGCRFHFSLCVPHDGFIAFIFSGAFTAPTNQVVCLDKIECLRLDRTSACVTEFTAFWMTKWVGSNSQNLKQYIKCLPFLADIKKSAAHSMIALRCGFFISYAFRMTSLNI